MNSGPRRFITRGRGETALTRRQRTARIACAAMGGALLCTPGAYGAVIGQTAPRADLECENTVFPEVQVQTASGPSYTVPTGGGEITSWSHNARGGAGQTLKLKIYRPVNGASKFRLVGETPFKALTPSTLNTFPTSPPVAVRAGDFLGLVTGGTGSVACSFSTGLDGDLGYAQPGGGDPRLGSIYDFGDTLGAGMRLNISAVVGPDHTAAVISDARAAPHEFAPASSARAVAAVHKGTTFRYALSEEATTKFTVARRRKGKTGFKRVGSFKRHGFAGSNAKHFSGRIGSITLAPGKYRASLVATDVAGNVSARVKVFFKIVSG
jgi:hypothetical protein